jgi:ABC-type antimicrobial peptide transport system permease subunit
VGVCALTSIMSVEQSWQNTVRRFFAPMDLATVKVALPAGGNWRERGFSRSELTREDVSALLRDCPAVESATLTTWGMARAETGEGEGLELAARSINPDYEKTLPDAAREGRLLTQEEIAQGAPVCLLSFEARTWLFGDKPAVGQDIRLQDYRFKVVGVISGNRFAGIGPRAVYVPTIWSRRFVRKGYEYDPQTEIFAKVKDPKAAAAQIDRLMQRRLGGGAGASFASSLWQVRELALHARRRVTLYSSIAGLCALLASGIGIAALLFVAVAESSREIGIRRALGGTRGRIYGEYVCAAVLLAGLGGILGALAGIPAAGAGAFASRWQPVFDPAGGGLLLQRDIRLPTLSEVTLSVSWSAAAIASVLALVTGALAALAPAAEAADIDPAKAIAQRSGSKGRLRKLLTGTQVAFGVFVLIVLTSYFSVLQSQGQAEARKLLGQDKISAISDPIAALRKPVSMKYRQECKDALAGVMASLGNRELLRARTPLLKAITPVVPLQLTIERGGVTGPLTVVNFTTETAFDYEPPLQEHRTEAAKAAFLRGEAVAVLNPGLSNALFGEEEPVGKNVTIAGRKFRVIGVRRDSEGFNVADGIVWAPLVYYQALKSRGEKVRGIDLFMESRIDAQPLDPKTYDRAVAQLREGLLPMLPAAVRPGIMMSEQIPETTKQFIFQHKAVAVRGAVGALAVLLVALIGLANMLLVSVHDAMKEIGLRRALGAQREEILEQFLREGLGLSAAGAIAGLVLGALFCLATKACAGLPISPSIFWAIVGALAAVIAGLVVSLFPALVASRINPIEALHYE